jgi:CelD/BcsL family acetyltransferase involved in cellulose biosynthesis
MLTKRFRRNIAADRRRLEEAGASTEYFHDISRLDEAFNDFVRLHTQAWESRGKEGYFAGKKGFEQFHRSVTAALMPSGEAEILFSRRGEERFAALQLFTAGRTGCPYLSGRDPGHTLARWSPGSILLTDAVARCIARGHRQVDLMEGESEQKHWLGGRRTWYCRLTFYRAGPPGTKGRLFKSALLLRRILELTPGTAFLKGSLLHLAARMRDKISANQ